VLAGHLLETGLPATLLSTTAVGPSPKPQTAVLTRIA
jgi:hypothetical protein